MFQIAQCSMLRLPNSNVNELQKLCCCSGSCADKYNDLNGSTSQIEFSEHKSSVYEQTGFGGNLNITLNMTDASSKALTMFKMEEKKFNSYMRDEKARGKLKFEFPKNLVIKDLGAIEYGRVDTDIHMMRLEVEKTIKKMMNKYSWKCHQRDYEKIIELIKR